ncbi:unnamed protein product [Calicophoron daubneyi]|uniref:Uncharacterized protein n=1 Tax=Calicophoron daubneyi TaxID=300641 RepID=A0AAV2TYM6_CALDB
MKRRLLFFFYDRWLRVTLCLSALLCLYALLWYFSNFSLHSEFVKTDRLLVCLDDRVKPFKRKISRFDVLVSGLKDPSPVFIPFVGNGYIGCSFLGGNLLIRNSGVLSVPIDVPILMSLDVHNYLSAASFLLDIKDGIMYKMNCFKHENELCVSSSTMVYAHRIYTSLLVQNFNIFNPLDIKVVVKVSKGDIYNKKNVRRLHTVQLKQKNLPEHESVHNVTYDVFFGFVELPLSDMKDSDPSPQPTTGPAVARIIVVVIFEPIFPEQLSIESGKTQSYTFITGVRASSRPFSVSKIDLAQSSSEHGIIGRERKSLEALIQAELVLALQYPEAHLRKLHTAVWNRLWLSGLSMSYSFAPKALNGDRINATLYYLAANTPDRLSAIHERNTTAVKIYTGRYKERTACFVAENLLQSNVHWKTVGNVREMQNLVVHWLSTLRQAHCGAYLRDGVHGVLQAALLHMGSFHLNEDYVSFAYPPDALHRDLSFRHIQLNYPGVYVNVEIRIVPGKGSISSPHLMAVELSAWRSKPLPSLGAFTQLKIPNPLPILSQPLEPQIPIPSAQQWTEKEDPDFFVFLEAQAVKVPAFVCPAGCQSAPIELKQSKVVLPYLRTTPSSALMYFSTNNTHKLVAYGRSFKPTDIHPGPSPQHDLITLHRHGHAFGGLPWLFWITLGLLIILFHLFICKIIYNELWRDKSDLDAENMRVPRYIHDLRGADAMTARAYIKAELLSRRRNNRIPDSIP